MDIIDIEAKYQQLEEKIKANSPSADLTKIRAAYEFALAAHGTQARKDGTPYITHPIAAAEILASMGLDEDTLIAALLHDCIEDTVVTYDDVAKKFSVRIADLVEGVTKLTRVVYTSKEDEQMENLRKMLMAMAKDIRVILIKIADRLHNMRTMRFQPEHKQREKSLETMEIYAPLAHRLGMQKIKWELEDTSLFYLDPVGYAEIQSELDKRGEEYDGFIASTTENIKNRLDAVGLKAKVYGRMKHMYGIYRKMYGQNKTFAEVLDLCAFRVIVDSVAECYNVLGYIHEMYRPLPNRFKDYIRTPKPNKYQSLHTTVIGKEGIPFEVQIRTWEMHETAEYGIAAHWKYKDGLKGHQDKEETFAWVRQLLEAQQDSDAQDFFHTLKIDMFADEVFVFTPRGDVVNLPAGSSPIDFAYSIHSAIGNHMTGAMVNGKIVPFDHVLENGDIVEVLTSKSAKGPSRDWLNVVKSSEARNKIRQWFKREKRDENILHGRASMETELKRVGLNMSAIMDDSVLPTIIKRFSFQSFDELCAAVGYGGISSQKAANRIRDEYNKIKEPPKYISSPVAAIKVSPTQKSVHGIVVEGLDNCLVKFAKCCTPVPGDPVTGFITRGYGVSVHRQDCQNYQKALETSEETARWVNVSWGNTGSEKYHTTLNVLARDRSGLFIDVAAVFTALKMNITRVDAKNGDDGSAFLQFEIEVKTREEVLEAISRINNVKGVREVKR